MINDPSITKHGLKIPTDVTSYGEFAVKMRVYEQEFKRVYIVSTVEKNPKDFFNDALLYSASSHLCSLLR